MTLHRLIMDGMMPTALYVDTFKNITTRILHPVLYLTCSFIEYCSHHISIASSWEKLY